MQTSISNIKKCAAIIVAGGSGQRMNSAIPKQFLEIHDKPILYYTIQAFLHFNSTIHIILVLPETHISYANSVLQYIENRTNITIIAGGATRYNSVQNGVNVLTHEEIIFIHDGVRPFVSNSLLNRCYKIAVENGIAIPCIPVTDSVRMINDDDSKAIDREQLRIVQTPQTFRSDIIRSIMQQEYKTQFTDEATAAEYAGYKIFLMEGDKQNIKITTQEDLLLAETIWGKKC